MPVKQINKKVKLGIKPVRVPSAPVVAESAEKPVVKRTTKKNKKEENEEDMTTEQFNQVEALVNDINAVKVVKKDRGLIERTESSKIILTEDNRQVLND